MKIVHVCQYYNDGFGYQENLLPRYQKNLGHDVVVITSDRMSPFNSNRRPDIIGIGDFEDHGIRVHRLPISWEFKGRFVWFKGLLKQLRKEKPNCIFHHNLTAPSLITCAKYKREHSGVFFFADNHGDLNNSARNIIWRWAYYGFLGRFLWGKIINNVDLVFGVTPARCSFAEKFLGIPHKKIRFLPIGADTDIAEKVLAQNGQNRQGKGQKPLYLVTGGKWTKEKRLTILLDAVEGLNVILSIIGDIEDSETLDRVARQHNVSFLGWQDRESTLRIFSKADIALWPGQHTTLMEDAIATNTPMLLRYHGNTSHHIRGNGLYFFSNNPIEIRQILEMIISNSAVLDRMRVYADVQRRVLSYKQVAKESIEYCYNPEPKTLHELFMEDSFCNSRNPDFERQIQ